MNNENNTERPLRILHFEDSPRDAEIIGERMIAAGFSLEMDWASNEQQFTAFLQSRRYDLFLADYHLPCFDGIAALRMAKSLCPGVPFICVSGAIGEEKAVELLKLGATDYVLKDRLDKLPLTIKRALDENRERTAHRLAEEELLKSKDRFRALVEATTDWIWEIDENSTYIYSSPNIRDLLGYEPEEINGKTPFDFMLPEDGNRLAEKFKAIKAAREPFAGVFSSNIHKDGKLVIIEASGVPAFDADGRFCGYRGINRDVTARKKMEQQYLQAQKMDAVGQLAGGIAHDFNNILTGIIGFQHLLLQRLEDEKSRHYAEQVVMLSEKAAALTQDLLTFSRKGDQTIRPRPVDLNYIINKTGKLLKRLIGGHIEFQTKLKEGVLPVMALEIQIEQVLMNLATNARDALPNGGTLTVWTDITDITIDFVREHGYGKIGRYALVSVSDNGAGMDEQTRKRVFEPFFTTKEVGKGTGLGLATAYGIIKNHNGYINVYSELGEGTTFRIYLPLEKTWVVEDEGAKEHILPARGTETVLLAEDDSEVRTFITSLLELNGYRVISAVDGNDALDKYVAHEAGITVLISDVIMPKRNGMEVYDIISKSRPGIKTLFISGFTADIVEGKKIPANCLMMTKPLLPNVFLKALRGLLDGADRSSSSLREVSRATGEKSIRRPVAGSPLQHGT
jgi:PAS domain S-box-containing protein